MFRSSHAQFPLFLDVFKQLFLSNFCFLNFLIFVLQFILKLFLFILLLLADVISLYCFFFRIFFESINFFIHVILNTGDFSSFFLSWRIESASFLSYKAMCIVINFLVLRFIWVPAMSISKMVQRILFHSL